MSGEVKLELRVCLRTRRSVIADVLAGVYLTSVGLREPLPLLHLHSSLFSLNFGIY